MESRKITNEKMGRKLVWHDEFDGDCLDGTKWTTERLMYNPSVIYDNSEKNLRVEGGLLHLSVNMDGEKFSPCNSVTTMRTMLFRYGYVEMRAKLPFSHGAWSSFWTQGRTLHLREFENRKNWFPEIDIFEVFSSKDSLCFNMHRWGIGDNRFHDMLNDQVNGKSRQFTFCNSENLKNEFHIYGMLWEKEKIAFYVDDILCFEEYIDRRCSLINDNCGDTAGFHDPQYLIINNEIFTENLRWYPEDGLITPEDIPVDYCVDYVRLYQKGKHEKLFLSEL